MYTCGHLFIRKSYKVSTELICIKYHFSGIELYTLNAYHIAMHARKGLCTPALHTHTRIDLILRKSLRYACELIKTCCWSSLWLRAYVGEP